MRHSRRFKWTSQANALSLARAAAQASGQRLIDLTVSNPTRAGIDYPPDLLAALADPRALRYEPEAVGLLATREAVAEYYASHGARVDPDQILLTASTSEAYQYLFKLLGDPGGEVLVPQPSYPLFEFLAGLELLDTISYMAGCEDPCNLATERTQALVAVHPNNPTGECVAPSAAQTLASRCAALDISLISDEVFLDYPLETAVPATMTSLREGSVFVLSGLSKICGLPQMKLGWMVLAGQPDARTRERLELIADTYLSVSAPVQWASIEWLRRRRDLQEPIRERIRSNSQFIKEQSAGSGIVYQPPQAGWTAVLELPSTFDEEVLVLKLLEDSAVLVQPGYFYDFRFGSRLVISLLSGPDDLAAGLEAIKAVLA